jgi:hypothetical protein
MKWEYVIERMHIRLGEGLVINEAELQLHQLGEKGWEAVTVWNQGGSQDNKTYVLLKRPKASCVA